MDRTLRALSALLSYPDAELVAALGDIRAHLDRAAGLGAANRKALGALLEFLGARDLLALQEGYVARFDLARATSLHLFEHVLGDSRDRGQAMVDLRERYRKAGLELRLRELPDYLPAVLEYLGLRTRAEARATLADCAPILRAVGERLRDQGSPYSAVFAALLELAGEAPLGARPAARAPEPSLDDEWAEAPAFGTDAARVPARSFVCFMPKS